GYADQRPADLDAPSIQHAEAADRLEQLVCERRVEDLDQLVRPLHVLFELVPKCLAPEQVEPEPEVQPLVVADHDVVEDRQRQTHARALEGAGDAGPVDVLRGEVAYFLSVELRLPRTEVINARQYIEERG